MRSSTELGGGVCGARRSITSSASALARWASSSVTVGMAGAALCSTVRVRSSPLRRRERFGASPAVDPGGAAQGLAGPDAAGALLGVVDDDHGDAVSSLQLAQIGEQRRDLAAGILIDQMQTDEGGGHPQ